MQSECEEPGPVRRYIAFFGNVCRETLFEREGIMSDSQKSPDRGWASVPGEILLPEGRIRIYYVSDRLDVRHGIVSAISDGSRSFTHE